MLVLLTWPGTTTLAYLPSIIALPGLTTKQYRRAYQELTRLGLIDYRDGSVQLLLDLTARDEALEEEADA